ncbi:MAG: glycosyltransferase family 2 protein [Cyclobacteriaceae bacterium]
METQQLTIAMTIYNRYDFFETAINSVINQTMRCPVLVLDNDSPHDKFEQYIKKLRNPLITYIRNERNIGMVENMNKCIKTVKTPWITLLHDDDALHPQFVEKMVNAINTSDKIGLIAVRNLVNNKIPSEFFKPLPAEVPLKIIRKTYFMFRNLTPFPGTAFKTDIISRSGGFKEEDYPSYDIYLWYRMASVTKVAIIDQVLAFYRISNQQSTFSVASSMVKQDIEFKQMVLKDNNIKSLFVQLGVEWAIQHYVKTYASFYPNARKDILKLRSTRLTGYPLLDKIMYRLRDKYSYYKSIEEAIASD